MVISYKMNKTDDKPNLEDLLQIVVQEIEEENVKIKIFVADAIERFICKGLYGHTGRYS